MILPTTLSAYLVKPDLSARRRRRWRGFHTQIMAINRATPHLPSRLIAAVLIWTAFSASVRYITVTAHQLPGQSAVATSSHASLTHASPVAPLANLTSATHAQLLPGGPTGQLLPPGTMAPDRTYANNYARGQCTWYVAGRRQVPPNWGNANQWYYHAISTGWAVGTVPAVAAIAWTAAGSYGHVALVEQVSTDGRAVYVSEMNYRGVGIKSFRWAAASSFKYIY
jgi:surface antigen